jgi:hypothetical protein
MGRGCDRTHAFQTRPNLWFAETTELMICGHDELEVYGYANPRFADTTGRYPAIKAMEAVSSKSEPMHITAFRAWQSCTWAGQAVVAQSSRAFKRWMYLTTNKSTPQ